MKDSSKTQIAELIDKVENLVFAAKLSLPPQMHVERLVAGLSDIQKSLESILKSEGGDSE